MIARFDGNCVRGVAVGLANIGTSAFRDLVGACEIANLDRGNAASVAETLSAGRFEPLPGSLKMIFITINPRTRRHGAHAWSRNRYHGEPMPIVF
jgi:hypothetical protein